MILYCLGLLIILVTGFLAIRFLIKEGLKFILHFLLSLSLGLGLAASLTFYTHILFGQFNRFIPVALALGLGAYFFFYKPPVPKNKKKRIIPPLKALWDDLKGNFEFNFNHAWGLACLFILAIPLTISAFHFPIGGWDAWSCWNLKAKFIFLGQHNWKDMFLPNLWRSNTQYPLAWPLLNVWFWDLSGSFSQMVPLLNGLLISLLISATLLFGLLELTGMLIPSLLAAVIVSAIPFGVILSTSQYSDGLLGLYLLSTFLCMLLANKYNQPKLRILGMIFLGLMSFTKNEGLVVALIAAALILWQQRKQKKELRGLIIAFTIAILPTIIFTLFMAPKNEAFINGLISSDKPITLDRIKIILAYPWFEFISSKWNGFWFLVLGGILLAGKKLWQSTLGIMGLTIVLYLAVVLAYYGVNTFFEIVWWMSTTLSRILFAVIPTLVLWIALGLTDV